MSTLLDQIRIEREQVDAMLLELRKFPVMWKPFTPIKFGISDFSTVETPPDGTKSVRAGPVVKWAKYNNVVRSTVTPEDIQGWRTSYRADEFLQALPNFVDEVNVRAKWLYGDWSTIAANTRCSAIPVQQFSIPPMSAQTIDWKELRLPDMPAEITEKKIDIMKAVRDMCR